VGAHPNFERSQDQAEVGMPFIITREYLCRYSGVATS
jgi:hypothetical protein